MSVLGLLYGVAVASQVLFVVLAVGCARAVGVAVREVGLGSPGLFTLAVRGTTVKLGPIPTASLDLADFESVPVAKRLVVRLGPWVVQLGLALALLGPSHALGAFARGFAQVLTLAEHPAVLAEKLLWLARHAPCHVVFGVVLAKVVAFNLLPFAMTAGGGALADVVLASRGKQVPAWWMMVSLVIALVLVVRWGLAFASAL